MADITMCTGLKSEERGIITCPFRKTCRSFTAIPNPTWQSWFTETPLEWPVDGIPICVYFLP